MSMMYVSSKKNHRKGSKKARKINRLAALERKKSFSNDVSEFEKVNKNANTLCISIVS